MERVARPAAVALSSTGNQQAARRVIEPRISGCPTAMPSWATNTRARLEANRPRPSAQTAVSTDQRDLGVVLIQKKNSLTTETAELEAELAQSVKDAETAKASLVQVQSEIGKLKAEKDRMLAKMASAQARVKIQEQLDGLSVDAEVKALDNVREHIKNTVAQANLGDELKENDLDARLSKLRNASGEVTANDEWEKLKAAKSAKATKTM